MWSAVLFGLLATPENIVSLFFKCVFSLIDTLTFAIVGVMYFHSKYFRKRWIKIASMRPTLVFWFIVIGDLIIMVGYAYMATISFQVVSILGVPVVTYDNILCVLFYATAIFFARDFGRRLVKRHKERKGRSKSLI
jgi:hypothetical protein